MHAAMQHEDQDKILISNMAPPHAIMNGLMRNPIGTCPMQIQAGGFNLVTTTPRANISGQVPKLALVSLLSYRSEKVGD